MATPVRSETVICSFCVLPFFKPESTDPSSIILFLIISFFLIACDIYPRSKHCEILSATTIFAIDKIDGSNSFLKGVSEPTAVI